MNNVSPKTAFYMSLWNNYKTSRLNEAVETSYIYRYMKKRKDEQAEHVTVEDQNMLKNSSRIDSYVYIKSLYNAYSRKQIKKEELINSLSALVNEKSNLRSFSSEVKNAGKDSGELEGLRDKLLDRCLRKDIQVFFNDIGYVEKMDKDEIPLTGKVRKNNEILDLYFGFIGESEWSNNVVEKTFSSEKITDKTSDKDYIKACQTLFGDLLSEEEAGNVFVPLFLDEGSAMGIFIIGRKLMNIGLKDHIKDKKGKIVSVDNPPCAYYLACFDETYGGGYSENEEEKTVNASFDISFEVLYRADRDGLEDLIRKYIGKKTNGEDYAGYPQNHNENMKSLGMKNALFKNYFVGRPEEGVEGYHDLMLQNIVGPREDQIFRSESIK